MPIAVGKKAPCLTGLPCRIVPHLDPDERHAGVRAYWAREPKLEREIADEQIVIGNVPRGGGRLTCAAALQRGGPRWNVPPGRWGIHQCRAAVERNRRSDGRIVYDRRVNERPERAAKHLVAGLRERLAR